MGTALGVALRCLVVGLAAYGTASIWLFGDLAGLFYLTNLSALALIVVTGGELVATARRRPGPAAALKAGTALVLVVVALVAATLLPGDPAGTPPMVLGLTYGQAMHVVLPAAALADHLLLDPHRRLRRRHVVGWVGALVAYLVVVLVRGAALGGGYPYAFLDVGSRGGAHVTVTVVVILAGAGVLGLGLVALDGTLPTAPLIGHAASAHRRRRPRA